MWMRRIRTFFRLPGSARMYLFRATALVGGVRIALWLLPFSWILRALQARSGSVHRDQAGRSASEVAWAVSKAARVVPGATCLPQAIAAQLLLMRAGLESRLIVGVSRTAGFRAHAWVETGGTILIGQTSTDERYVPVLTLNSGSEPHAAD